MKFGTSGIRGVFDNEINSYDIIKLAESIIGNNMGERFFVGFDSRRTSMLFTNVLVSSLSYFGKTVVNGGCLPTPVIAYSIKKGKYDIGFSITASHNPSEYVGIKVFDSNGMALSEEKESMLESYNNQSNSPAIKFGKISYDRNYENQYKHEITKMFSGTKRKFKILVDCSNGVTNNFTPVILSNLGHSVASLNSHRSHLFPGHNPEPIQENLASTVSLVKKSNFDFGFVHDGDGDRLVIITKDGIVPDYIFSYLIMSIILEERKGDVVISINSSNSLEELALKNSCESIRTRLGKTFILLDKKSGVFATEPSKVIDPFWGLWEDGIYAAVKLVQFMSKNDISMPEMISKCPKRYYNQKNIVGVSLDIEKVKSEFIRKFQDRISGIQETDGLRFILDKERWVLFRSSGTERKTRIYVESSEQTRSDQLMNESEKILSES